MYVQDQDPSKQNIGTYGTFEETEPDFTDVCQQV